MQESRINVETPDKDTSTWGNDGRLWESMCRPAASSKAAEPQAGHRSVESVVAAARAAAGARVLPDAEWKDDRGVTHRRENGQESVTLEKVEPWVPSIGGVVRFQAGYHSDVGEVIAYENGHVCVDAGHGSNPDDVYRVQVNCLREATPEEVNAFRSYAAPAKAEPVDPARPAAPEWLVVGAKVSYKRGARKGATVGTVTAVFTSELNGVCEWYGAVLWPDGGSESMRWQGLVPADADVPVVDHIAFSWAVEGANIRDKRTREVGIVERVYTDADGEKHMDVVWPSADEGSDRSTERCFEGMQYEPVPASEGYAAGGQPPAKAPLTAEDAAAYADDYAFLRGEFAVLAEERSAVAATLEGAATRLAGIQQALDVLGPVLDELKAKVTS